MDKSKEAKMAALKDLKSKMHEVGGGSLGEALKGADMMKATVVAKDKEGLEAGLEKAKDVMEHAEAHEESDFDSMSREELIAMLKRK